MNQMCNVNHILTSSTWKYKEDGGGGERVKGREHQNDVAWPNGKSTTAVQ